MDLDARLALRDRRADFEHVRAEHHRTPALEVVGVVLHEAGAAGQAVGHQLHRAHQCSSLPVSLCAKAKVIHHQSLDRETRELCEAVQILEVGGEAFEIALFEKMPQPCLNAGPLTQGLILAASTAQRWRHLVPFIIVLHELINLAVSHLVHILDEIAYAVAGDIISQPDLGFHLIPFSDSHFAHIVAEAGDLRPLSVVPGTGSARPRSQACLDIFILPVPYDNLSVQAHPAADEPEFAVSVGGLVQIHEVHVDFRPRYIAIVLRVHVRERLLQSS